MSTVGRQSVHLIPFLIEFGFPILVNRTYQITVGYDKVPVSSEYGLAVFLV